MFGFKGGKEINHSQNETKPTLSFDPDKRIEKPTGDQHVETKQGFDPDKRIERPDEMHKISDQTKAFDPDKRIEKPKDLLKLSDILKGAANQDLAGKKHPETGVSFTKKIIDVGSNKIEGVFAKFESKFDAKLPKDLLQATDKKQFAECNKQLLHKVENNDKFAEKFTPKQLEQIKNGDIPEGYVWHHNEEVGKMQLVDSKTHNKTAHVGGRFLWGGGTENR